MEHALHAENITLYKMAIVYLQIRIQNAIILTKITYANAVIIMTYTTWIITIYVREKIEIVISLIYKMESVLNVRKVINSLMGNV